MAAASAGAVAGAGWVAASSLAGWVLAGVGATMAGGVASAQMPCRSSCRIRYANSGTISAAKTASPLRKSPSPPRSAD